MGDEGDRGTGPLSPPCLMFTRNFFKVFEFFRLCCLIINITKPPNNTRLLFAVDTIVRKCYYIFQSSYFYCAFLLKDASFIM